MDRPLRVGGVPYLVGAPLIEKLKTGRDLVLTREAPSDLARGLRAGRLDVGLVSSIEAFRRPGYRALADLGIASTGEVRSVLLFARTSPEDVRTLAVDRSSETSVALSRILLARRFGGSVTSVTTIQPTLEPDAVDADAVLLIGDAGLNANPGPRRVLDLGAEWLAYKGLPFVFALWLMRMDDSRARLVGRRLREAWLAALAANVDDGTGGRIQYELGAAHREGLAAFHAEAAALGLCSADIEPTWISPAESERSGDAEERGRCL